MKQPELDDEFANAIPRHLTFKEPNPETFEAIREGDAFLATGESGRFDNGADLINAVLNAHEV